MAPRDAAFSDITQRCFEYSLRAIRLYQHLHMRWDSAGSIIGKQLLRSATSIGANVEEAQAAESRPDFIHKMSIAQKEARESLYWLRLLTAAGIVAQDRLEAMLLETGEISAVISAIVVSTKRRLEKDQNEQSGGRRRR